MTSLTAPNDQQLADSPARANKECEFGQGDHSRLGGCSLKVKSLREKYMSELARCVDNAAKSPGLRLMEGSDGIYFVYFVHGEEPRQIGRTVVVGGQAAVQRLAACLLERCCAA